MGVNEDAVHEVAERGASAGADVDGMRNATLRSGGALNLHGARDPTGVSLLAPV
ncbi:hypothetical protein ACH41H_25245 [Streptomyces sp. NPDC020800]|uniref:hypothetical protein n=1 Tax=Streptomyces sp. NPDC020800 TaxID=3365092 RepID=UPI0037B99FDF